MCIFFKEERVPLYLLISAILTKWDDFSVEIFAELTFIQSFSNNQEQAYLCLQSKQAVSTFYITRRVLSNTLENS